MSQGFRYPASWAGIAIDVTGASVRHGRTVPQHLRPRRDGASLEDTGRDPWVCQVEFLFLDRDAHPGEPSPLPDYEQRFTAFDVLVDSGATRTLVHPYQGAVRCKVEGFEHRAAAEDGQPVIRCSATFIEDGEAEIVFAPDPIKSVSGPQSLRGRATQVKTALSDTGAPESAVLADVDVDADRWGNDPTLSSRQVYLEMVRLRRRLSDEMLAADPYTSIERYPIARAYHELQWELVRAFEAYSSSSSRVISLEVTAAQPLRTIAANFYGAAQADARLVELLDLNPGLRTPALVPAGTTLRAYALVVH